MARKYDWIVTFQNGTAGTVRAKSRRMAQGLASVGSGLPSKEIVSCNKVEPVPDRRSPPILWGGRHW